MCTNNIFTQCDVCGRNICYGNAMLEISRNVEQHDYEEETGLHVVKVVDSDLLLELCARCSNSMADRKNIWKHLVFALDLPAPATVADAARQIEEGLPETCGRCGVELEIGKERVSLVRDIAQVEWSDELNNSELYVIDGEDILSFCPDCGNKMSTHRLKQALHALIDEVTAPERMELIDIPPDCVCGGFQYQPAYHSTPVAELNDEERERQRYEKKAELLRRVLKEADEMDKEMEL